MGLWEGDRNWKINWKNVLPFNISLAIKKTREEFNSWFYNDEILQVIMMFAEVNAITDEMIETKIISEKAAWQIEPTDETERDNRDVVLGAG